MKSLLTSALLVVALMWPVPITAGSLHAIAQPGANLLTNPGHEPPAVFYKGRAEVYVAWNWMPFWDDVAADKTAHIPQFRPAFAANEPARVRSGQGANRYFNYFSLNKNAGLMQMVEDLPVGSTMRFTSWVQLDSSDSKLQVRLCIDPDGGAFKPNDPAITCSAWAKPNNQWVQLAVDGITKGNAANAIIWSRAETAVEHNDVFVDDSCFELLARATDSGVCKGTGTSVVNATPIATPTPFINPTVKPTATPVKPGAKPTATPTVAPAASIPSAIVIADGINVRQQPNPTAKILGGIKRGEVLLVIGRSADGKWFEVLYKGAGGWVFASLVKPNAAAQRAPVVK